MLYFPESITDDLLDKIESDFDLSDSIPLTNYLSKVLNI